MSQIYDSLSDQVIHLHEPIGDFAIDPVGENDPFSVDFAGWGFPGPEHLEKTSSTVPPDSGKPGSKLDPSLAGRHGVTLRRDQNGISSCVGC